MKKTSEIKIIDNHGFDVEMKFLRDVIKKYEKKSDFLLKILVLDKGEKMVDVHAVTTANVCT